MRSLRPRQEITYEIKGFQQVMAVLPDKGRTYKVIDNADTIEQLVNHGFNTFAEATMWAENYLWRQYDVSTDRDRVFVSNEYPATNAARRARKIGNLHYRYRHAYTTTPFPVMKWALTAMHYIIWGAHLSNFSFKKRTRV